MPAFFGSAQSESGSAKYHNVTSIIVSYLTDRDKLARYIPAPFEVAELPIISVAYSCNKEIDWLAGRCYNLIGINAAVKFSGVEDQLEGYLTLVMWENLTDPILTGREFQGIPKIYADIPDHQIINGKWSVNASHFSNRILSMSAKDLIVPSDEEIAESQESMKGKDNWLGWKYIPSPDGVGADVSYPTIFPSENETTEIWVGQGSVQWEHLTWEQNPTQSHIVNALADLPILDYVHTAVIKGSCDLAPEGQKGRALK